MTYSPSGKINRLEPDRDLLGVTCIACTCETLGMGGSGGRIVGDFGTDVGSGTSWISES